MSTITYYYCYKLLRKIGAFRKNVIQEHYKVLYYKIINLKNPNYFANNNIL